MADQKSKPAGRAAPEPTVMDAAPAFALAPEYEVLHDGVGMHFRKGDRIPPGTYDDEQLARLVGLGAIRPVPPAGVPEELVADVPDSAEAFKAEQTAASMEAVGGEADRQALEADARQAARD